MNTVNAIRPETLAAALSRGRVARSAAVRTALAAAARGLFAALCRLG